MKAKSFWFGAILILIGAVMLLNRFDLIDVRWSAIAWSALTLFGAQRAVSGFSKDKSGSVLGGTVLFLVGLFFVLRGLYLVDLHAHLLVPVILVSLGIGLAMIVVRNPRQWHLIIPALALAGMGVVFFMTELGYLYRWDVIEAVGKLWPAAVILFGASLILKSRSVR